MAEEEKDLDQPVEPLDFGDADLTLAGFVLYANTTDISYPITLFVNGAVVSGRLVGGHQYFQALESTLTEFYNFADDPKQMAAAHTLQKSNYGPSVPRAGKVGFIHLLDAQVFQAGRPIVSTGVPWRGRLDAVNGFHFGNLKSTG